MIHSLPANPGLFFPRSSGEIVRSHLPSSLPPSPPSCQDLFSFPSLFPNMSSMMETWQFQSKQQPREGEECWEQEFSSGKVARFQAPSCLGTNPVVSLPPTFLGTAKVSLCCSKHFICISDLSLFFRTWTRNFKTSGRKRFPGISTFVPFWRWMQGAPAGNNLPLLPRPRLLPHHPDSVTPTQRGVLCLQIPPK